MHEPHRFICFGCQKVFTIIDVIAQAVADLDPVQLVSEEEELELAREGWSEQQPASKEGGVA
jgi:hypothetical protein